MNSLTVNLQFSASNLMDKDTFSKSDPMCVVYELTPKVPSFGFRPEKNNFNTKELFRTARIKNNLNPNWEQVMTIKYKFEEEQWLFIQVLDVDEKHNASASAQDFLGGLITTLGRIVNGQENGLFKAPLTDKNSQQICVKNCASMIHVKSTVIPEISTNYTFECRFTLESTRLLKSDTPLIQVKNANGQVVYETVKGHGKVSTYPAFTLSGSHIAPKTTWHLTHNHAGDHIGDAELTEQQLSSLPPGSSVPVLKNGKQMGMLMFLSITKTEKKEELKNNVISYLNNGGSISAMVAIDFTGSNGDPKQPHSLHYLAGNNQYRNGIASIVPIIDQYDADGKYPVFGYGLAINGNTSHCKVLTEEASYSDGVIMAYENTLHSNGFDLSGPTYFSPVIRECVNRVKNTKDKTYTVLVIFTDGAINDMDETIKAVVEASYLPMSIIVIGVGNGDFGAMNRLDNDGQPPLKDCNGRSAKRDIVQFVPLRNCPDGKTLQAETLAELPRQIMEFGF